jgi:hypothetical protein
MARAVAQGPGLKIKECPPLRAFLYIKKQVHLFIFTLVPWESVHYLGKSPLHLSEMPRHGLRGCNILYNVQILTQVNHAQCDMFVEVESL